MKNNIICAIDTNSIQNAVETISILKGNVDMIKLGLEFFLSNGLHGLAMVSEFGIPIFLDLKLHDIPNTVSKAISALPKSRISLLTVHISGGIEMLKAAVSSAHEKNITIVGVTVLTSIKNHSEKEMTDRVLSLCEDALNAGVNYIVCSAFEVSAIKDKFPNIITIVPGIRSGNKTDDHKRSKTPEEAAQSGAEYLVIGRPITESEDPLQSLCEIKERIRRSLINSQ